MGRAGEGGADKGHSCLPFVTILESGEEDQNVLYLMRKHYGMEHCLFRFVTQRQVKWAYRLVDYIFKQIQPISPVLVK